MDGEAAKGSMEVATPARPAAAVRRRWFRFSLCTLVLAVLLIASAGALHHNWEPWYAVRVLGPHNGSVVRVAFSADGSQMLTHATDRTTEDFPGSGPPSPANETRVWDTRGALLWCARWGYGGRTASDWCSACFTKNCKWVHVTYGHGHTVLSYERVFDARTGADLFDECDSIPKVVWTEDSRWLCVLYRNKDAELRSGATGRVHAVLKDTRKAFAATFSPDGRKLLTIHDAQSDPDADESVGVARLWHVQDGRLLKEFGAVGDFSHPVFTADGQRFVLHSWANDSIVVKDTETGKTICEAEAAFYLFHFIPGSANFLLRRQDDRTCIFDGTVGKEIATVAGVAPLDGGVSPDGKRFVTISSERDSSFDPMSCPDTTVRIWNVQNGKELASVTARSRSISTIGQAYWLGGRLIISGLIWDYAGTGKLIDIQGHGEVSPDGLRIASITSEKGGLPSPLDPFSKVSLWDSLTGERLATLRGHNKDIVDLVWSPDSKYILTASRDKTARLWTQRRPESLWGVIMMPELWLTVLFGCALAWSLVRDRRSLSHGWMDTTCSDLQRWIAFSGFSVVTSDHMKTPVST